MLSGNKHTLESNCLSQSQSMVTKIIILSTSTKIVAKVTKVESHQSHLIPGESGEKASARVYPHKLRGLKAQRVSFYKYFCHKNDADIKGGPKLTNVHELYLQGQKRKGEKRKGRMPRLMEEARPSFCNSSLMAVVCPLLLFSLVSLLVLLMFPL